jgi:UDPglucose--hexose-1-phosphate uridylyltransferase
MASREPTTDPLLRHDVVAARTVFVAPRRADRPDERDLGGGGKAAAEWCPFCAGNEGRTPAAVLRMPADEARPWHARIVPNRYPFAAHAVAVSPPADVIPAVRPAHGVHDVVIESAAHESNVLAVPAPDWRDVWELCRQRLASLAARDDLVWATVFKNSGPRAGASLAHLHSQLVALDFVPPVMQAELAAATASADPFGRLLAEAAASGRIVAEQGGVVLVVPPAPRQPFESWILPREPEPFFHATRPGRVAAVADLTRLFVEKLGRLVPDADFNWWLHQLPAVQHTPVGAVPSWHWHLEILPRLSHFAGFELGTGCHITTVSPEDSAQLLRDA